MNVILTGGPGVGKSTLLRRVIDKYNNKVGFTTTEVWEGKNRLGFEVYTSAEDKQTITSTTNVTNDTNNKVGKYYVDINKLDNMLLEIHKYTSNDLLYIDEIGSMQLLCPSFKSMCLDYLDSDNRCIATIKLTNTDSKFSKFIKEIKSREDVTLIEVTKDNRDLLLETILKLLEEAY